MNDAVRLAIVAMAVCGGVWLQSEASDPAPTPREEPATIAEHKIEPAPAEVPKQQPEPAPVVSWATEREMRAAIQRTGKPAWLLFSGPMCAPCETVRAVVLKDPEAIEAAQDFVCVKMKPSRASAWGIQTIPRSMFCDVRDGRLDIISVAGQRSTVTPTNVSAFVRQLDRGFEAAKGVPRDAKVDKFFSGGSGVDVLDRTAELR